jgi:hypothetical protein
MSKPKQQGRRDMGIAICIILGLVIGELLKNVEIGLIIGLGLGWVSGMLISGRK